VISVIIPVYRNSKRLKSILKVLTKEKVKKEIIVVVDEPDEEVKRMKFRGVKFVLNGKRIGKPRALNLGVELSKGDVLLFLDADTEVKEGILKKVEEEMKDCDILELRKEIIKDSKIAKVIYYDYIAANVTNWFMSKTIKRCVGVNGAAFAMKRELFEEVGGFREVPTEDMDIAIRTFERGKFKYLVEPVVKTEAPSTVRALIKQRKRWSIGGIIYIRDHYEELLKGIAKHPIVALFVIFTYLPALAWLLLSLITPEGFFMTLAAIILAVISNYFPPLLSLFLLISPPVVLLKNILLGLFIFMGYLPIFYFFSRKLGYEFHIHEFLAYYFIYSPFWLLLLLVVMFNVFIYPRKLKVDWVPT